MIFSMDNYYYGGKYVKEHRLNFDQPEAINIDLYKEHLEKLKKGEAIPKYEYKFDGNPPKIVGELKPPRVVISEGLFTLHNDLKESGDIRVFVDIGPHGRMIRRLLRDVVERNQTPKDIVEYFAEIVEPMHEQYIKSTKQNADFIIKNEYKPEIEARRSNMYEVQVKFKGSIDAEKLRKIGAERLSSTEQVDYYYNPKDRDLTKTGEIIRIREEKGSMILTYKGPKNFKSEFRERPKFEFEIDKSTENKLLRLYGDRKKIIKKKRTLYQLDGIVFSLDYVSKIEDSKKTDLGNFIEIRTTAKSDEEKKKIENVMSKLGLKKEDKIIKAYVEM